MLVCAEQGEEIEFNPLMLPFARIMKGNSWIKNQFESEGPIPEGMSATQALKSDAFIQRHKELKEKTSIAVDSFIEENGYKPPDWELVKLAEKASGCKN